MKFMAARVNLRLLEVKPTRMADELPPEEFADGHADELVRLSGPLVFEIDVSFQNGSLLVDGSWQTVAKCLCARCLAPFDHLIENPSLMLLIPLEGEDAASRDGDFVDLTPYLREDTLLALPTHPLCDPDCQGLAVIQPATDSAPEVQVEVKKSPTTNPTPWDALNDLNLQ